MGLEEPHPLLDPVNYIAGGLGTGLAKWINRPYWQYYPAGNPGYASNWVTRGLGWKAPYAVGQEAVQKLSLPANRLINPNPATAVRQVKIPWWQPMRGPHRVDRANGQPGGGWEFKMGWKW